MKWGSGLTRRRLLRDATALGTTIASGSLLAACDVVGMPRPTAAPASLPPPETRTIRIAGIAACDPWAWMCEPFFRDEGFTEVVYPADNPNLGTVYSQALITGGDAGRTISAVAGLHTGCLEIWARPPIATVADIRGKAILVGAKMFTFNGITSPDIDYGFWISLLAHVGMQASDVTSVETGTRNTSASAFLQGRGDAILTLAAQGPLLQANPANPGRVILNTTFDKPWSQQICCMLWTEPGWARSNPVALKRATRAILRTIDEVARDRPAAARIAMEKGIYKEAPAITEKVINEVNKDTQLDWRNFDAEGTLRFFAQRLSEGKLIRKTPQQAVLDVSDLAWFRQMQKELKP